MNKALSQLDLNLLLDLDVLLQEGSVIAAAKRLHLSSPAMSRRLMRLREAMGDPLFVPAGRGLVPTGRALALKDQVRATIEAVRGIFTPDQMDLKKLRRTFTVRANDGFAGSWAARLSAAVKKEASGVCLNFLPRSERTMEALRSGAVDLEIGVIDTENPEIHSEKLFVAELVGVVRSNHPILTKGRGKKIDAKDLVAWEHISTSQHDQGRGRLDQALRKVGLQRTVAMVAPGFQAALMMAASSDMIAMMPEPFARWASSHLHLEVFTLPLAAARVEVSHSWHARHHIDPVHRWFRGHVKDLCHKNESRKTS